jgi:iron(III) transport system permease protein
MVAILLMAPIFVLFWQAYHPDYNVSNWQHLLDTWLGEALLNSFILAVSTALLSALLGTSLAWLSVTYRFAGSQWMTWLLILPLALPPYIVAMLLTWWADSGGSLHLWLRELGWVSRWADIRNLPLLIVMFSLLFMPYTFLLARASFQRQGLHAFEAARALGLSPFQAFFRVVLPITKPSIIAGSALVMMETLADYGATSLFSVPTLTQAIYRSWFNLGDWTLAAQLAIGLISVVALVLLLVQSYQQDHQGETRITDHAKRPHHRISSYLMSGFAWGIFFLAFLLPILLLLWQSVLADLSTWRTGRIWDWLWHSSLLALGTALLASSISTWLAWQAYRQPSGRHQWPLKLLSLGYGIPGTALAVAILLTWQGLGLAAGVVALMFAYLVRFMSLSIQSTQAGLTHLSPRLLEAADLHGYCAWKKHRIITLPLLSPHILAGSLMVAIEVLKELPATLMLRPFNFDTLAVIAYQYAQDERIPEAANAALLIVLVSLLGLFLVKWLEKKDACVRS